MNESNFEKSPYGGFHEQAGSSRVLRQDNNYIAEELVLKVLLLYIP